MDIIRASSLDMVFSVDLMNAFEKKGFTNPSLTLFALDFLNRFINLKEGEEHKFAELLNEPLTKIIQNINEKLLETHDMIEHISDYRRIGDFCLYTLTFRNGFITKTIQDPNYCISFGTNAYSNIGDWLKGNGELFNQLSSPITFKTVSQTIKEVTQQ